MKKKRIFTLIMIPVLLVTMVNISAVSADGKDYDVVIKGYLDSSVKYGGSDTYRLDFQVRTLNGMGIATKQSLKIAYDASVLKLLTWTGKDIEPSLPSVLPNLAHNIDITYLNATAGHDEWAHRLHAAQDTASNTIFLLMEPDNEKTPEGDNYVYPVLTAIESIRFTFQSGKGFADMKPGTIRFPNANELHLIAASCLVLISDGDKNNGGFSYYSQKEGVWDFTTDTLKAPVWDLQLPAGVTVSGNIRSYNPNNAVTIDLIQGGEVKRSHIIPASTGSGQVLQPFTITGVASGAYTLRATKRGHLSYTKLTLEVGASSVNVGEISLTVGDINGDGIINSSDLLRLTADYGKSGSLISDPLVDFNGDGIINSTDLLLLTAGYGKMNVIEQ